MTASDDALLPAPAAILFDLDGTLVDTVAVRVRAWVAAFHEAGIPVHEERIGVLIGSDGRRLARDVAAEAGVELDWHGSEALDHRSGALFTELNRAPQAHAGVTDLLADLDASGIRWAVATSSRPEQVQASLDALALGHQPTVTDGSHVEHAKPAPDLLLSAADQLGVPPSRCWYVGDSTWDMLAARAAGMAAIGIATGAVDEEALRAAGAHVTYAEVGGLHEEMTARGLLGKTGAVGRLGETGAAVTTRE